MFQEWGIGLDRVWKYECGKIILYLDYTRRQDTCCRRRHSTGVCSVFILICFINLFVLYWSSSFLSQVTILWKIRGNSQESFTGKSGENFNSNSEEFLVTHFEEFLVTHSEEILETHSKQYLITRSEVFLVTHSEEFPTTLSKELLVANSREFLVTNSAEKLEKSRQNLWKFLRISREKFLWTNSWELFPRFSQEFLKNILTYS